MKLREIKILTDENISPRVAAFLKGQGVDVLDTKEQNWFGMEDEELLEIAHREERFVFTHDSDFGTPAVYEKKHYHGIIYLRLKNINPRNIINVCKLLLALDVQLFPGAILVVEETRVRIRYPADDTNK